ncbi:hypothetical protein SNEBB_000886 [Seison nebaliae]|nr:hypothetical protein SNEBB_000886 [Seison nebaliae]
MNIDEYLATEQFVFQPENTLRLRRRRILNHIKEKRLKFNNNTNNNNNNNSNNSVVIPSIIVSSSSRSLSHLSSLSSLSKSSKVSNRSANHSSSCQNKQLHWRSCEKYLLNKFEPNLQRNQFYELTNNRNRKGRNQLEERYYPSTQTKELLHSSNSVRYGEYNRKRNRASHISRKEISNKENDILQREKEKSRKIGRNKLLERCCSPQYHSIFIPFQSSTSSLTEPSTTTQTTIPLSTCSALVKNSHLRYSSLSITPSSESYRSPSTSSSISLPTTSKRNSFLRRNNSSRKKSNRTSSHISSVDRSKCSKRNRSDYLLPSVTSSLNSNASPCQLTFNESWNNENRSSKSNLNNRIEGVDGEEEEEDRELNILEQSKKETCQQYQTSLEGTDHKTSHSCQGHPKSQKHKEITSTNIIDKEVKFPKNIIFHNCNSGDTNNKDKNNNCDKNNQNYQNRQETYQGKQLYKHLKNRCNNSTSRNNSIDQHCRNRPANHYPYNHTTNKRHNIRCNNKLEERSFIQTHPDHHSHHQHHYQPSTIEIYGENINKNLISCNQSFGKIKNNYLSTPNSSILSSYHGADKRSLSRQKRTKTEKNFVESEEGDPDSRLSTTSFHQLTNDSISDNYSSSQSLTSTSSSSPLSSSGCLCSKCITQTKSQEEEIFTSDIQTTSLKDITTNHLQYSSIQFERTPFVSTSFTHNQQQQHSQHHHQQQQQYHLKHSDLFKHQQQQQNIDNISKQNNFHRNNTFTFDESISKLFCPQTIYRRHLSTKRKHSKNNNSIKSFRNRSVHRKMHDSLDSRNFNNNNNNNNNNLSNSSNSNGTRSNVNNRSKPSSNTDTIKRSKKKSSRQATTTSTTDRNTTAKRTKLKKSLSMSLRSDGISFDETPSQSNSALYRMQQRKFKPKQLTNETNQFLQIPMNMSGIAHHLSANNNYRNHPTFQINSHNRYPYIPNLPLSVEIPDKHDDEKFVNSDLLKEIVSANRHRLVPPNRSDNEADLFNTNSNWSQYSHSCNEDPEFRFSDRFISPSGPLPHNRSKLTLFSKKDTIPLQLQNRKFKKSKNHIPNSDQTENNENLISSLTSRSYAKVSYHKDFEDMDVPAIKSTDYNSGDLVIVKPIVRIARLNLNIVNQRPEYDPLEAINRLTRYDISRYKRGGALIIANSHFINRNTLPGKDIDCSNFSQLFSQFGFHTKIEKNLNTVTMKHVLEQFALEAHRSRFSNNENDEWECVVLLLTSHGLKNKIFGTDEKYIQVHELVKLFSSVLPGRPKLLFIDTCRGDKYYDGKEPSFWSKLNGRLNHAANKTMNKIDTMKSKIESNAKNSTNGKNITNFESWNRNLDGTIPTMISEQPCNIDEEEIDKSNRFHNLPTTRSSDIENEQFENDVGTNNSREQLNKKTSPKDNDLRRKTSRTSEKKINNKVKESDENIMEVMKDTKDLMIGFATVEDYVSWADHVNGSNYIKTLVDEFAKNAWRRDIVRLMKSVGKRLATNPVFNNQKPYIQEAEFHHSFTKDLYFYPGYYYNH